MRWGIWGEGQITFQGPWECMMINEVILNEPPRAVPNVKFCQHFIINSSSFLTLPVLWKKLVILVLGLAGLCAWNIIWTVMHKLYRMNCVYTMDAFHLFAAMKVRLKVSVKIYLEFLTVPASVNWGKEWVRLSKGYR